MRIKGSLIVEPCMCVVVKDTGYPVEIHPKCQKHAIPPRKRVSRNMDRKNQIEAKLW